MAVSARLVSLDGTELLRFSNVDSYRLSRLDLGFPEVRESSTPMPGRDGEYDTTAYHGASAVTMEASIPDGVTSKEVLLDRLRGYSHPGFRAYLHVSSDGWPVERRTLVRGTGAPVTFLPGRLPLMLQVGWRAPSGRWESTTLQSQTLYPTTGAEGGITFPITFPITFGTGNVPGAAIITNGGTVPALPYIDIYGYCTDPVIANLTTGKEFGFTGLTVQAGDFIRVDMDAQAALLTNVAGQSRYSLVDFTTSTWWGLEPGAQQVAFVPGNPGSTCSATIYWRDTTI